ncbi:hypothetical protein AAE478_007227 [Parahypoxylon ruwenzoriense]
MAFITPSSTVSSSPIPFEDSDSLNTDLQPAPLRLPQRKPDINFDGSASNASTSQLQASTEKSSSTSTIRPLSPLLPPTIAKTPSQRRTTAAKLGPLVSKFEILDAVNNADTSPRHQPNSLFRARPSAIPRAQVGLRQHGQPPEAPQRTTTPMGRTTFTRHSPRPSPRQVGSPPLSGMRSKLPVSKIYKTMGDDFEAYAPFTKLANPSGEPAEIHKPTPGSSGSSLRHIPTSGSPRQNSPTKSKFPASLSVEPFRDSHENNKQEHQSVEQIQAKKYELHPLPQIPVQRQQPSVADLRKSFEQNAHPLESMPEMPGKLGRSSEGLSIYATQCSKEPPRSSGSVCRGNAPSVTTRVPNDNTASRRAAGVIGETHYPELRNNRSGRDSPTSQTPNTLEHASTVSFPARSQLRQGGAELERSNLDGTLPPDTENVVERNRTLKEAHLQDTSDTPTMKPHKSKSHAGLIRPFLSKARSQDILAGERCAAHETTVPAESLSTPKSASKLQSANRSTGKVSDLRKLFERSSPRGSSPNSFRFFWQNRSRVKPVNEAEKPPIAKHGLTGTPTTVAVHSTSLKAIPVPELTTKISIDNFFCDFPQGLDGAGASKPKARPEATAEARESVKEESPVKDRIQQFECLERGSPAASPTPCLRTESFDSNSHGSIRDRVNSNKTIKNKTNWRPFRQRSMEMWRRISSTFTRPVESGNNSNVGNEQLNSSVSTDTDYTQPRPAHRQRRYHRSGIFSYHLYRTSEVDSSSTNSSRGAPGVSINDELMARFENQPPYLTYTRPSPRRLPMRRTFPYLARISNNLGCLDELGDFGLDGSVLSKAIRHRDMSPVGQDSQRPCSSLSSSLPQGDAKSPSKMVSKQTMAERKRRRLEEKKLRREQKEKKKEDKARAKGKEKEKVINHEEDRGDDTQDKGKGKEVAGKERKESSWSKKTASGFVVRQINDVKLRHPKPRRPGQVKKIVNMYKEKASSGIRLGKGSGVGSVSGGGSTGAVVARQEVETASQH